jgi:hypothetical protein
MERGGEGTETERRLEGRWMCRESSETDPGQRSLSEIVSEREKKGGEGERKRMCMRERE